MHHSTRLCKLSDLFRATDENLRCTLLLIQCINHIFLLYLNVYLGSIVCRNECDCHEKYNILLLMLHGVYASSILLLPWKS